MSVVNLKYPDGRVESKKLLSAINKNGTEIAVIDLEFVDNGHKVTGVLYNSDGFYHNIVDQAKWDEIRSYLVESIHGTLTDADYQVLSDINVSVDPYRQLSLRDENFVSLVDNYEAFLNRNLTTTTYEQQSDDLNVAVDPIKPEELVSDTLTSEDIVNNDNIAVATPTENDTVVPTPSVPESDKFTDLEAESVNMNSVLLDNPVVPEPQVDKIESEPAVEPAPSQEETSLSDLIANAPVEEPVSTVTMNPFEEVSVNEDIQSQSAEDSKLPDSSAIEGESVAPEQEVISIMDAPITDMPVEEENTSVVTDSYMNNFENLKASMNALAEEAIQKIENIRNEFNAKIDELAVQAKGSLQEAKAYGELARDTFDKAQTNVTNLGLEQQPINDIDSQELNLKRAA